MEMEPGVPRGPGALGPEGRTQRFKVHGFSFRVQDFGLRVCIL